MKRFTACLLFGLILGLLAGMLSSPRGWRGEQLETAFTAAVKKCDANAIDILAARGRQQYANDPAKLLMWGRLLDYCENMEILESFYRGLNQALPQDSPVAVEALFMLGKVALMQKDERSAEIIFHEIQQRYWDYKQSIDAEAEIVKLQKQKVNEEGN